MTVILNHTIVPARDKYGSGQFFPHDHLLSKDVDGQRSPLLELRQNRELGRAQPDRCQELIIKLN
jgi:hypothetical protein